ncbi:MAG TPA: sigma factor-like helix-turn-helix DNA-binding protein [Kofleriaceae bacterium]|jgi:RNA polymerase sigma-70 factor (ECF subfamily)
MSDRDMPCPEPDRVHAWVASAIERGRVAWPGLAVSHDEMTRVVTSRLASSPGAAGDGLDTLDVAELYIASACARGDAAALVQFRGRYFQPIVASLRRMDLGDAQLDDIWQALCDRLLVRHRGELPRILHYAGRGQLGGLVRVAATRMALNWRQRTRCCDDASWIDRLPAGHADPELHAIKLQHRSELKQELETAIADLSARERMILRLHLVERMGIDAIAALCSVHRATAARSVARAKQTLTARVRTRLIARWRVADADLPALKTLVDSQLDLSLTRLLAT